MTTTINEKSRPTGGMDGAAKGDEASTLGVGVRSGANPIRDTINRLKATGFSLQDAYYHPEMKKTVGDVWKTLPDDVRAEIDQYVNAAGGVKYRKRLLYVEAYMDQGRKTMSAMLKESHDYLRKVNEAKATYTAERAAMEERKKRKREEFLAFIKTPRGKDYIRKKRDYRRNQRAIKAAKLMLEHEAMGYRAKPQTSCLMCHKPLVDQISILRGIGPDCWQFIAPAYRAIKEAGKLTPKLERELLGEMPAWQSPPLTLCDKRGGQSHGNH